MDTDPLVEEQIEDGRKLVNLLGERDFDVTAACWTKTSEEGIWFLYIASKQVDRAGLREAYGDVFNTLRSISDPYVSSSEISLVGNESSIAKDLVELARKSTGWVANRSFPLKLGQMSVDAVYIYPPPVSLRLMVNVRYRRKALSNSWTATTKRGELYRGMKAKGAVTYTTAHWEGERADDPTSATVGVLLEIDPRFDDKEAWDDPGVWQILESQARAVADEMFKARHPDAVIVDHEPAENC
jgi:hypothetical protein